MREDRSATLMISTAAAAEMTAEETDADAAEANARGGMTRLFINLGKNQNVKPGDILGAIAGESGIPGRLVGSIDMYDKYTFVEVPKDQADIVMDAMNHVKIKGKSVHVEKANRR
mgnify:CR=1 FL=1